MRTDARNQKNVTMVNVQGYHSSRNQDGVRTSSTRTLTSPHGAPVSSSENYAFAGFRENYYINSDRLIKLDEHYRRADGQPLQGVGIEMEVECSSTYNSTVLAEVFDKIIFPCFKHGKVQFKLQRDGSLGGASSVECISQVMTISRVRNDYAAYKAMFDTYFTAFGISADSYTTSCGMHVNISNALFGKTLDAQKEAIRKLFYIVNKHYALMCEALYRNPRRTGYCGQQRYDNARRIVLEGNTIGADHCSASAVNLSHFDAGRIELRLVGGQKDFDTFRETMETVFHLINRVRTISWSDCDSFAAIFKGCNQYVVKRVRERCSVSAATMAAIDAAAVHENFDLVGE